MIDRVKLRANPVWGFEVWLVSLARRRYRNTVRRRAVCLLWICEPNLGDCRSQVAPSLQWGSYAYPDDPRTRRCISIQSHVDIYIITTVSGTLVTPSTTLACACCHASNSRSFVLHRTQNRLPETPRVKTMVSLVYVQEVGVLRQRRWYATTRPAYLWTMVT